MGSSPKEFLTTLQTSPTSWDRWFQCLSYSLIDIYCRVSKRHRTLPQPHWNAKKVIATGCQVWVMTLQCVIKFASEKCLIFVVKFLSCCIWVESRHASVYLSLTRLREDAFWTPGGGPLYQNGIPSPSSPYGLRTTFNSLSWIWLVQCTVSLDWTGFHWNTMQLSKTLVASSFVPLQSGRSNGW